MQPDPLGRLFDESRDAELDALLDLLGRETEALKNAIPDALDRQWSASPVPKPREDTTQRASGKRPNPTADIVFDDRRLAVRATVTASAQVLREAVVRVRGVRVALETAVARYDGPVA